jgi:hypothetical protein
MIKKKIEIRKWKNNFSPGNFSYFSTFSNLLNFLNILNFFNFLNFLKILFTLPNPQKTQKHRPWLSCCWYELVFNGSFKDSKQNASQKFPEFLNQPANMSVTAKAFQELGQEITNRRKRVSAKTEMSRFKSTFGTSPMICATLWSMITIKNSSTKWSQASSSPLGFGFHETLLC